MNILEGLKQNNTVENTKGGQYYATTYDSNLDMFAMLSRYNTTEEIIKTFSNALYENEELALANLLYLLDIRNGKGERKIFKTIFKYLCENHQESALRILPFISELGRYDYILEGINTAIEDEVITLIKKQLEEDMNSDTPSLLAKWLPSHRTHNKNNKVAKQIIKRLNITEKQYRKLLAELRRKLNLVERNLTAKTYEKINFSEVPTKAMLKYAKAFNNRIPNEYQEYKTKVQTGETKINTTGLFSYEIIKNLYNKTTADYELYDLMWKNQKDILKGNKSNVLVMADTSGSMTYYGAIPYATSVGLALYIAERNEGIFKNHFMTFSDRPILCEVKGNTIREKVANVKSIVANTNIDEAFKLLLDTAIKNKIKKSELPSHIIIVSDMEFDEGVYSIGGTNLNGWKQAYKEAGYDLPIIIFWNVAGKSRGIPATKYDNDVCMISGFSTNILENILNLENYSPNQVMLEKLNIYLEMLSVANN